MEGRGLKPQSSVSRRDGVRSYLLNLGKGQVRCALSSCGDWSPRLSLAALLLSRGHQGGSHVWRRVLVVRWHRAVGRQGPLGVMLEQSPAEYPHAEVGVFSAGAHPIKVAMNGRRAVLTAQLILGPARGWLPAGSLATQPLARMALGSWSSTPFNLVVFGGR